MSALEFSELEGCAYWRVGKKDDVHWGLPKVARGKATRRDANEATFESLGIDSLETVEMVMELEEELDVELELEEKMNTIGELVDFIESKI